MEMGDSTRAGKELWEGLGGEDKGVDKGEDKGEDKVSKIFS